MKYTTLNYDANKPIVNQITEPINSQYGIAVKVFRDNTPLDASISVGGIQTEETGEWKTAILSTGSIPTIKQLDVEVHSDPTITLNLSTQLTAQNNLPIKMSINAIGPLSSYISSEMMLPSSVIKSFTAFANDKSINYANVRVKNSDETTYCYNPSLKSWMDVAHLYTDPVGSITIDSNSSVLVVVELPAKTSALVDVQLVADSEDELDAKFKLQVQEKDLGYIELQ